MSRGRPLTELDGCWVTYQGAGRWAGVVGPPKGLSPEELGEVVGVSFDCPACGPGGHRVAVPFSTCPPEARWCSGTGGWEATGTESLETLTLSPSINCEHGGPCTFHGWVRSGRVTW